MSTGSSSDPSHDRRDVRRPAAEASRRRDVLPTTRDSVTHKFTIAGHEGYLTVGLFEDGRPGEIFMKMSKEGSTLSGMIQGFCRAFSLALQYGLSVRDAVDRFRGMRFDPAGPTSNPDIPEVSSIMDYIARYLEIHFVDAGAPSAPAEPVWVRMGLTDRGGRG